MNGSRRSRDGFTSLVQLSCEKHRLGWRTLTHAIGRRVRICPTSQDQSLVRAPTRFDASFHQHACAARTTGMSSQVGDFFPVEASDVSEVDTSGNESKSAASGPTPSQEATRLDRLGSAGQRPRLSTRGRNSCKGQQVSHPGNGTLAKTNSSSSTSTSMAKPLLPPSIGLGLASAKTRQMEQMTPAAKLFARRPPFSSPWSINLLTLVISVLGIGLLVIILNSLVTRQLDAKGCRMSYMRPSYVRLKDFDTEHTRFASKYSLYLYREQGVDDDTRIRGIPVLFIPGNAGSYKQVRPIAAEAANYFHDVVQQNGAMLDSGVRGLDFFTADLNEDITAFHGQTLNDQAEFLNEAIRYILSLYLDPTMSDRDAKLPDPSSVIILGHSMGGIVARTMLTMPNYQCNSINTIITMSAPHARPPVSFDGEIVNTYRKINDFWRDAYSQQWASNNPLWQVTLVSIAGGGLDTVVPSDYTSVESIVPETHGFTVFTSTIPTVWTSMDHQAILWCDQFRKVVARALYDIVDANRPAQTRTRAERMKVFKKRFLTGMETMAEKDIPHKEYSTLLTLAETSASMIGSGESLVLRKLGFDGRPRAHLLPIPSPKLPPGKRFTLLSDVRLDNAGENGKLEVLFCSVFPLQPGHASMVLSSQIDLSGDSVGSTRLACKNAASDVVRLPASSRSTRRPYFMDGEQDISPFSYLEYGLEEMADDEFVVIIEKGGHAPSGFAMAEFSDLAESHRTRHISLHRLSTVGIRFSLPARRPMVTELKVPSLRSSLWAYRLQIGNAPCGDDAALFAPLVRQYLTAPYESKFIVDAHHADISLHGVAPYVPPRLKRPSNDDGLSFQFWIDPTCDSSISVSLQLDVLGSLGKLYMRYRTVLAAFPLLVVALVLRKQFRVYDTTGVFITFSDGLDSCLRQLIPLVLALLMLLWLCTGRESLSRSPGIWPWRNATLASVDFYHNDVLLGTQDGVFWFLLPIVGLVCVGITSVVNYLALALTHLISILLGLWAFRSGWTRHDDRRKTALPCSLPPSPRRRMITTALLLLLVSTVVPYQFAYLVACVVQLFATVRAKRLASELRSTANSNTYNYVHSIFILMLWVLPINLPILVVWIHNLAVRWLTPLSSHRNIISVAPFIILVETLTTGRMVPRVTSSLKHVTSALFFGIAIYAAMYGVSYAYMLHYLVNIAAAWLLVLHSTLDNWSWTRFGVHNRKRGKEP